MQTTLADLRKIGEALNIITTEIQINPYWEYSKLLDKEEVLEFLEKTENCDLELLKDVAYYILTYAENITLAASLANDFDSNYLEWMMPCLEKLRKLLKQIHDARSSKEAYRKVRQMIDVCLNYGIDPL